MVKMGTDSLLDTLKSHVSGSISVKQQVIETCIDSIRDAVCLLANSFKNGGKVLLTGNGGSAADCQHMATEFVSRLSKNFERPALPAIALTTDTSFLTAFTNDCGFDGVFERQVQALGKPGDVLIGISTSGNSRNIIRAMHVARSIDMRIIALTGQGGEIKGLADVAIVIPSKDTQYVQEAHLMVEHILCGLVERQVFCVPTVEEI